MARNRGLPKFVRTKDRNSERPHCLVDAFIKPIVGRESANQNNKLVGSISKYNVRASQRLLTRTAIDAWSLISLMASTIHLRGGPKHAAISELEDAIHQ